MFIILPDSAAISLVKKAYMAITSAIVSRISLRHISVNVTVISPILRQKSNLSFMTPEFQGCF